MRRPVLGGAPFGLQLRLDQIGPLRPSQNTPITGLHLAGTSTAWGPGTVGSMLSGVFAASAVTERDLVDEIRRGATIADRQLMTGWVDGFDALTATRTLPR